MKGFLVLFFLVKELEENGRSEPGIGIGWGEGEEKRKPVIYGDIIRNWKVCRRKAGR